MLILSLWVWVFISCTLSLWDAIVLSISTRSPTLSSTVTLTFAIFSGFWLSHLTPIFFVLYKVAMFGHPSLCTVIFFSFVKNAVIASPNFGLQHFDIFGISFI